MEKPYQMLLFDGAAHKILHVDGSSGSIISQMSYPPDIEPVDTAVFDHSLLYILAIHETTGKGVIFQYFIQEKNLQPDKKLRPLPIPDIAPLQFAVDDKNERLIIACEDGRLYVWKNHALSLLGHTQPGAICVGIQITSDYIYTIWEHEQGGIIALLDGQGTLLDEYFIPGIPTHLAVTTTGLLLIPYTCTIFTGEGLLMLETRDLRLTNASVIPFNCPFQPVKTYPAFVAVNPTEDTAYIIHEDGGFISKIDLAEKKLADTWLVGHSMSSLHFLPDSVFAIGPSYKFADLTLIDLHVGEPVSITNSPERRLLGLMTILSTSAAQK